METAEKKVPLIQWQAPMQKVLYALVPVMLASVYFFGWRSLVLLVVVNIAGFLTEYLFLRQYKEPVSSAVLVTSCIFALTLPPALPLWMAVVGIVFGVLFGKMVFGGFGRNVFNPAMVGRAFIYVAFASDMTSFWYEPVGGTLGGLLHYTPDTVSSATSLARHTAGEALASPLEMFLGNISGSLGETSALLIILGGLYLIWKKTANYRIVLSTFAGFVALQTIFYILEVDVSTVAGTVVPAMDPLRALLSGGFLFGAFFVATDPVSASQTNTGRWLYGAFIGMLSVLIRVFAGWPEGFMFAVLLGNMFAPITDYVIKQRQAAKKAKA